MDNLSPIIFLIPFIALTLVIFMFIYLVRIADDVPVFKHFVFTTVWVAFILNFAWELVQMPLYKNAPYDLAHIAFCALASVADVIMVLLIYFCFALIYKNPLWVKRLNTSRILLLMLVGGLGAIVAEVRHLSAGNWAYDDDMPILPFLNVGLSPLLQFMLLPTLIYYLSHKKKR